MSGPDLYAIGTPSLDRGQRLGVLREMGFDWANLDKEEYWVDQAIVMERRIYQELVRASDKLWRIFDKAARFVWRKRDLYEQLAIPPVLWEALDRLPIGEMLSRYARFDFAVSQSGEIKLLELNADTPTGYVEAAVITPWVCEQYRLESPNRAMPERLAAAWAVERPEYAGCVGYGKHLEDTGTINMLVRHSGLPVKTVDCLDLRIEDGWVLDPRDQIVHSMFALYPKEWMTVDPGGEALAFAIVSGRLRLYNPVHAILLQSKGLQALIWGLHELGFSGFEKDEHETIETYMLPTYTQPVLEGAYVSKAMFGREGGSVRMFDGRGRLIAEDREGYDTGRFFPLIYQQKAELAKVRLYHGEYYLLTGMFMIQGKPSGLLGRAGGLITGNSSHFIAMGVR
jgi:glutathionylspermidine synthase